MSIKVCSDSRAAHPHVILRPSAAFQTSCSMPSMVHHPSKEACESMSLRLSKINDLRLPAALLREHPYPEASAVQQHLQELLYRDAAVFLERYGLLLTAEELSTFEPLRENYEVSFYLDQAEAAQQQQQQDGLQQGPMQDQQQHAARQPKHLSSTVKNRRLAFMRRLEQQGEYFSEHAMREREPLVWQDCIGRHEGHPVTAAPAGEGGFAGSLLASYDEAMVRARLQQEMEDEEAAMSEHDSDSDMADDDMQPPLQEQQGIGQAASISVRPTAISTPSAASAGRTEAARAGAAGRAGLVQQQQPAAAHVDMGPDAMARRRQDFLLEMQHRFLEGMDGEHHSYAAIDADVSLDDDWAKEQAQDAEDAYFDAD